MVAALLSAMVAGCGGGGGIDWVAPSPTPVATGNVTLTIKDAPLSDLASFSIDISNAVLKGAGNPDATIFPGPNAPTNAIVTVDLLSAQAFSVLLSSATVPVGNYYAVELTFSNPQAVTHAQVAQTVQTANSTLVGLFTPTLQVSTGSSQTIQVDVDLQNSVVDLGPTSLFLAPVVIVDVLNQPTAIQQMRGLVTSLNVTADSFVADILFYGANAPRGGSVTVQCSSTTGFKNGSGAITTGNVTAQLVVGDVVSVDGTLLAGTITATMVQRLPNTSPGIGAGPQFGFPSGLPPFTDITGTITAVSTTASTISLRVHQAWGPGTPPSPGTTVTIDVVSTTTMSRGNLIQTLADFVPGNKCHCFADATATGWEALDLSEAPAMVSGTVVSLVPGTTTGLDLLTFTTVSVDQIPVAQLPFIPATMTADIPSGSGLTANANVGLVGFFDGTAHFDAFGRGAFPGNGGPGSIGGGFPGLPGPIPMPPMGHVYAGTLTASSTAALTAAGIEFSLDIFRSTPTGPSALNVTVTSAAAITMFGASGLPVTLTPAQAVAEINSSGNGTLLEVEGTAAPSGTAFTADVSLLILKGNSTLPGPGPGPGPGPTAYYESGTVTASTTATVTNSDVVFSLDAWPMQIQPMPLPNPTPVTLTVTVTSAASMTLWNGNGPATTLTAAQAAAELTAAAGSQNVNVEVIGSAAASAGAFTADVSLTIWVMPAPTYFEGGSVPANSTATEAAGVVTFQLESWRFSNGGGVNLPGLPPTTPPVVLTVTVPVGTSIMKFDANGSPSTLTAAQAATELTAAAGNPNVMVQAEGTAAATSTNTFTADVSLTIMVMPATTPGPGPGPGPIPGPGNDYLSGTVVGTATLATTGEITFTLARGANLPNVTVTTTASALLMLISTQPPAFPPTGPGNGFPGTGIAMLTPAQAVAELNASPLAVEAAGTLNAANNTFSADSVTIVK